MDKAILRMLLALVRLMPNKNVDFRKLTVITETKVLMDRRRMPATYRQKQRKDIKDPLFFTLIIYVFLGALMSSTIYSFNSIVVSMTFIHGYFLFMMAMTLITDFSSVLLDTADNQIIFPKPVNSETLFLARIVHILVYLLQFTLALAFLPILTVFFRFGLLSGFVFIFTTLLTIAFSVFVTYLMYGVLLQFGNEQKIKDIVNYFQLFMTIFFAVGFQVLPRLINFDNVNMNFALHWYSYLLPPVWMAMTVEAFYTGNFDEAHFLVITAAIIVPVSTVWIMMKFLAPIFSRKLGALSSNTELTVVEPGIIKKRITFFPAISNIVNHSPAEQAGFNKVWRMTSRDKTFRMQFYPSVAYLFVFGFIFVFKSGQSFSELMRSLPSTTLFLWLIYLPMLSISSALTLIAFNENFAASWVYQSAPLYHPGEVISGALKALIVKFFIPVYGLVFCTALYIWGIRISGDFIFGFFNNLLIFFLIGNLSDHYLPFSRQPGVKEQTGKFSRLFIQFLLIGTLVGAHWLALKVSWLPVALVPISAGGAYFFSKKIRALSWSKIAI